MNRSSNITAGFLSSLSVSSLLTLGCVALTATAVTANTCASRCSAKPLQFTPGQRIEVLVRNRTQTPLELENTGGDRPIKLLPGQQLKFYRGGSTDPNLAIAFWEATATPLKATLSKPKKDLLQIDLTFAPNSPGDQAIYIRNDGQIDRL